MIRNHDALVAFIEGHERTPFAYGAGGLDCVRFAAGAVLAQTGRDPLRAVTRRWTSARGAQLALARSSGMAAAVDGVLRRIDIGEAMRGDIAGVPGDVDLLLTVVEGATLVGLGPDGMQRLPRSSMTHAWSIA
jgi:hypothetical protein